VKIFFSIPFFSGFTSKAICRVLTRLGAFCSCQHYNFITVCALPNGRRRLRLEAALSHNDRVHRASGFLLTAFPNARPNPLFCSTQLTQGASEKALASLDRNRVP
jgi:hypothetical protein